MLTADTLSTLYVAHAAELGRFLGRRLHPTFCRADVDDLVQETFCRAWAKRALCREDTNLRAWLYTIAHNLAIDATRRAAHVPQVPVDAVAGALFVPSETQPEAVALGHERAAVVHLVLGRLTPKQRVAVWRHDALGYPNGHQANKNRVHLGRRIFRQHYPASLREAA